MPQSWEQQTLEETQAIYGEAEAGRSAEVRKALANLVKKQSGIDFDMAELLAEVKSNRYWDDWNFESVYDYAKKEIGISPRQVDYLVRTVYVQSKLGLPRERIEHIGSAKLREIFSLDPDDFYVNNAESRNEPMHEHIARLLTEADPTKTTNPLSVDDIKTEVKRLKGMEGDNAMEWVKAKVTRSSRQNVHDPAIALAKRNIASTMRDHDGDPKEVSDGAAWEVIAQNYLNDPNSHPEEDGVEEQEGNE